MQHGKNGRPRGQLTYAWPLRRQPGERVDAARYARTLALAFAFYPPWQQIFGEEHAGGADAEWALRCGVAMAASGRAATAYVVDVKRDHAEVLSEHGGVLLAQRQDRSSSFSLLEKLQHGFLSAPLLGRALLDRLSEYEAAVDALHASDLDANRIFDHVFISSMGVHPSAMHHGVGADLLANALADADEARLPTYLVCDSSLVPVFRKFGFAPGGERALGAVVLRGMLRTIHVADVLDRWGSRRHHRPRRVPDPRYRPSS